MGGWLAACSAQKLGHTQARANTGANFNFNRGGPNERHSISHNFGNHDVTSTAQHTLKPTSRKLSFETSAIEIEGCPCVCARLCVT